MCLVGIFAIGLGWQIFRFVRDGGVHVSSGVRIAVAITASQSTDVYDELSKLAAEHRLSMVDGSVSLNAGWRSRDTRVDWRYPDSRPAESGGVITVFGFNGKDDWQALSVELESVLKKKFQLKSAELQLDPREYDCQPVCNGRKISLPLNFSELKAMKRR